MAKNSWNDYSSTAASNTDVGGVDIQGTAPASNMDDGLREQMSHTADVVNGTVPVKDTFTFADPADLTKRVRLDAGNVTAGQTRVLTVPNFDGTIATLAGTETHTNKTLTSPVLTTPQINDTTADHQYVFAVSELAADRTVTLPLLGADDTFVFADFIQTLTNKKLEDGTTTIVGSSDATKAVKFEVDGLTTATTRTVTVPDKTGTMAMTSDLLTSGTAQATTSGTAFNFTSIPSWVKRITVLFDEVSVGGNDHLFIQIGDSGGLETDGYVSSSALALGEDNTDSVASTAGFVVYGGTGGRQLSGIMTLCHVGSNKWVATHSMCGGSNAAINGGGVKTLSATLDRLTLTRSGSNSFDNGSVNIMYE